MNKCSAERTALDFYTYTELQQQPTILSSLVQCYRDVFAEPGTWEESYSEQEVLEKLELEMSGQAALRLYQCEESGDVIAFCWAQFLSQEQVVDAICAIHYFEDTGCHLERQQLANVVGASPQMYLQDLGVKKSFRGTIPLDLLILPVLESIALRCHSRQLFFWTVKATCVSRLAYKAGIDMVWKKNEFCFFRGNLPSMEEIAERCQQ